MVENNHKNEEDVDMTGLMSVKKGDEVVMLGFTGIRLCTLKVAAADKKTITVETKKGELVFDRKTGVQQDMEEGKEKYANKLVHPDDAPEQKAKKSAKPAAKPAKKEEPKKSKKAEPVEEDDEDEDEEDEKPAKTAKKADKKVPKKPAKKVEPEEDEDDEEDDDEDYEEV